MVCMLIMVVMLRGHTWGTRPYRQLRSRAAALWQFGGLKTVAVKIAVNSHDVSRIDTARIHKASAASSLSARGCDDHGVAFVAAGDELENHAGFGPVEGQIANLIDHKDKRRKLGVAG
jgi:hypothetical protein